jgi:hypothetical protein
MVSRKEVVAIPEEMGLCPGAEDQEVLVGAELTSW